MTPPLDVGAFFRRLADADIDFVLIGGLAVNAHGVIRSTKDIDIVPSDDRANLKQFREHLARPARRALSDWPFG